LNREVREEREEVPRREIEQLFNRKEREERKEVPERAGFAVEGRGWSAAAGLR
jgi:hypothetical protein